MIRAWKAAGSRLERDPSHSSGGPELTHLDGRLISLNIGVTRGGR